MKRVAAIFLCIVFVAVVFVISSCGHPSNGIVYPEKHKFSTNDAEQLEKIISSASWDEPPINCIPDILFFIADISYAYDSSSGILINTMPDPKDIIGTGYNRFDEETALTINGILAKYVSVKDYRP